MGALDWLGLVLAVDAGLAVFLVVTALRLVGLRARRRAVETAAEALLGPGGGAVVRGLWEALRGGLPRGYAALEDVYSRTVRAASLALIAFNLALLALLVLGAH